MLIRCTPPPRRWTGNHCNFTLFLYIDQGEKLAKVIKASGNEVEAFWPSMFAKALKGQNIEDLLSNVGSAAPVAVAVGGPVAAAEAKVESKITTVIIFSCRERREKGRRSRCGYGRTLRWRRLLRNIASLDDDSALCF